VLAYSQSGADLMCGIAGLFRPRQPFQIPAGQQLVRRMIGTLEHRGPDADGLWCEAQGRCILGHRRLSIIDTSESGRQPFVSNGGRWVITFNGEIYNFRELKPIVERAGGSVRGRTDTEILLQCVALWGVQALEKLDGMFAFAAYDTSTGDLILARDAFGEKPLYLMDWGDGGLAFASELQALECLPGFDPTIDMAAMGEVLCFQYIGAPRSIYRNVRKLGPGEWLCLRADGSRTSGRFFAFEPTENVFDRPLPDLADELEDILVRSVRRRTIADVPLGAFLSGGVDSSTVCALLRRRLGVSVSTFSIGFKDEPEDEHKTARAFARHLETDHHELIVDPHAVDFLEKIGGLLDEPNADSSLLPTFFLSGLARQHVTVALGGDGGDEMFGGYTRYFDTLEDLRRHRQHGGSDWRPGAGYHGLRLLAAEERHLAALFGFVPRAFADHIERMRDEIDQARGSLLAAMRRIDMKNYLPGAVLGKVDRMSMRHSLEVRTPYLSIELARFAERLPDWTLLRGRQGKLILREVARRHLPGNLVDMPKRGFGLPIAWLQKGLLDVGRSMLNREDGRLASAFGHKAIENFIASDIPQRPVSLPRLWGTAMLESWLRHHPATIPDLRAERTMQSRTRFANPQATRIACDDSEVSVVVLTTGERTTQAAIDSLHRQTRPLADIIVVRDVAPFHKAFNTGAAQVKTPFFVQLDADMVLDDHCVGALLQGMQRDVGIVVGHLRDPLMGQVVGVKLFRKACFEIAMFVDSISPDTDFVARIARAGWKTSYIGRLRTHGSDQWATYGAHNPDYSLPYTYRKYLLEGCRYCYRQAPEGIRWHFGELEASEHPSALAAQAGLAHGIFLNQITDLLAPQIPDSEFAEIAPFLSGFANDEGESDSDASGEMSARECFHKYYRLGSELRRAGEFQTFHRTLRRLRNTRHDRIAWISKIALCKGLQTRQANDATINADFHTVCRFLLGPEASFGSIVTEPLDRSLVAATAYAADIGLSRFAIDGTQAGEYCIDRSTKLLNFRATGRKVMSVVLPNGRPRVELPFQLFGHFMCTEPENVTGIFWCFDLLKSGYIYLHIPTPLGPTKMSLLVQLTRNCLSRLGWLQNVASRFQRNSAPQAAFLHMARRKAPGYHSQSARVLMITSTYNLGGSERQMLVAASDLLQRGYDVRIMALYSLPPGTPNIESEVAKLGIKPQFCSDFLSTQAGGFRAPYGLSAPGMSALPPWFRNKVGPVHSAIQQYRPAVVHAWTDIPAVVGAFAACSLGSPRVVLHQCSMQWCMRRHGDEAVELLRKGYRSAASNPTVKIINNSVAGAADYESWLGLRRGAIRVLYNAIAGEQIVKPQPEKVASLRTQLGLPQVVPIVGTVMRFVEDKDPDLWLATAAEIAKARPDVHFLLAGYGELQDRMTHRIDALGLQHRAFLCGPATDTGLIYAAIDVVLLTSLTEGVPNVLIEAQAAGRPVVAADVGGVGEAVADGRTGCVVPGRSPQRLAAAVLDVLGNPSWAMRAEVEGPAFVTSRFGRERMISELLEFYGLPAYASVEASHH
jgi:asparagine synthase (glutamine-hydrolysing)